MGYVNSWCCKWRRSSNEGSELLDDERNVAAVKNVIQKLKSKINTVRFTRILYPVLTMAYGIGATVYSYLGFQNRRSDEKNYYAKTFIYNTTTTCGETFPAGYCTSDDDLSTASSRNSRSKATFGGAALVCFCTRDLNISAPCNTLAQTLGCPDPSYMGYLAVGVSGVVSMLGSIVLANYNYQRSSIRDEKVGVVFDDSDLRQLSIVAARNGIEIQNLTLQNAIEKLEETLSNSPVRLTTPSRW